MSPFLIISLGIITASVFGFFARLLKQPLLIGYLFGGLALALTGAFSGENRTILESLSQLGITFLLFLVGLEMNVRELPTVGRSAFIIGLGQIIFTTIFGYFISILLGFDTITSLYIGICLTFSSTIIIIKLLSEKKDLNALHGKISIGLLLVQDLVAMLILMFLSGFQSSQIDTFTFFWVLIKGFALFAVIYFLSKFVLNKLFDKIATISSELLFIGSLAWALLVAVIVSSPQVGFSIEIGGLIAGLALANSSEHLQIASRVRPLRDFFITIFFLLLGAKMVIGVTPDLIIPAGILSIFVLVGNPLIVIILMGILGYKKRTSFLSSVNVAQISEFSFIVIALGEKLGHVQSSAVGLVTLVGVVTMTTATYLILNGHIIYRQIQNLLSVFERKHTRESAFIRTEEFSNHIVLIGADRTGLALVPALRKREERLLVVDFNPEVVGRMESEGIAAMYGDIADIELLDMLNINESKLLISTINSLEDNLILLEQLKKRKGRTPAIFVVSAPTDALKLYDAGADYVVVPRITSGEHLAHVLNTHGIDREYLTKLKSRSLDRIATERY